MDYRELLKKYMALVADAEGVTFIDDWDDWSPGMTREDYQELIKLHREVCEGNERCV